MLDYIKLQRGTEDIWLFSRKFFWWPARKTVVVADLHLGKGQSFCKQAQLIPPYDTIDTLGRLKEIINELGPEVVICLGDSFHHNDSYDHIRKEEKELLYDLACTPSQWIWIKGNHDTALPSSVTGLKVSEFIMKPFVFAHQPLPISQSNIQIVGHFHPKLTLKIRRQHIVKPCFAWNYDLMILPSFGSYTGGLEVNHPEIKKHLGANFSIATAETRPYPILINFL